MYGLLLLTGETASAGTNLISSDITNAITQAVPTFSQALGVSELVVLLPWHYGSSDGC